MTTTFPPSTRTTSRISDFSRVQLWLDPFLCNEINTLFSYYSLIDSFLLGGINEKTRKHRIMIAAIRTVSFVMTLVMLFTLFPASSAMGEVTDQSSDEAKIISTAEELCEQTFELNPEDGVTVTLKGLMPTDGYAQAKAVNVNEENVLHAYDITIFYRNGKEFVPDEGSPISVSFNSKAIADAIKDEDVSLKAAHIDDNGEAESVALPSAAGGEAVFEAESFSIYFIKEHDNSSEYTETPRVFYHFLSPDYTVVQDGADYVPVRFVMVGEETDCLSPAKAGIPTRPGYNFTGWWCKVEKDGQTYDV